MPFPSLSAHQGKVVDHTTIRLSLDFVSLTITKASLSGEWQLRVTHTPLPFIYHVHRVLASTSNREHPGPRMVTWLDNLVTGGALAPVSDRSSHSLSPLGQRMRGRPTLPPGRSSMGPTALIVLL